jgi:hypothetical protein
LSHNIVLCAQEEEELSAQVRILEELKNQQFNSQDALRRGRLAVQLRAEAQRAREQEKVAQQDELDRRKRERLQQVLQRVY